MKNLGLRWIRNIHLDYFNYEKNYISWTIEGSRFHGLAFIRDHTFEDSINNIEEVMANDFPASLLLVWKEEDGIKRPFLAKIEYEGKNPSRREIK